MVTRQNRVNPLEKRCEDLKLLRYLIRPSLRHEKHRSFLFSILDLLKRTDPELPATLFFTHASARVATPIGEPILSGEYPQMDKNWGFWMSSTNPNSHRLTDHDKCVVESTPVFTALQYIATANESSKSAVDDSTVDSHARTTPTTKA